MTITEEATSQPTNDDVEALFPEARRRRRRIRISIGAIVLVVAGAASVAAIDNGGHILSHQRPGTGNPPIPRVSAAEWAQARHVCEVRGLRAIPPSNGGAAHLYGAYPTTVRLAVNWPTKIYPLSGSPTPTTAVRGSSRIARHFDPWSGFNSSRPATICIFTGDFAYTLPSMQGNFVQRAKVFLVYVGLIGATISITPTDAIPATPVPVA